MIVLKRDFDYKRYTFDIINREVVLSTTKSVNNLFIYI